MEINIVDAIMGRGKTASLINYINSSSDDVKFLYITPYLTEVNRVIQSCPTKKFKQPEAYGTKMKGIKFLFEKGINIASTHSLFKLFDQETIELAYQNNYVLIMDEVAEVIESLDISKFDLQTILEKYTEVQDGHILKWVATEYEGDFEKYKKLCDLECVGIYKNSVILWLFPISTFKAFKKIYILTYLFNAQLQKYYFDFYNLKYKNLYVQGDNINNYTLTETPVVYDNVDYKSLISICNVDKLNRIGDFDSSLSKSWYDRNKKGALIKLLKNNTSNFFRNHAKTKTQFNLWTTFKDYQCDISGKGYAKGFLPTNARATNEFKNRTSVAYLVNRFFNPYIKNFFICNNIEVDEDMFALSEMLQFLFRSAIRESKHIDVYIPSKRMRELLENWLSDKV